MTLENGILFIVGLVILSASVADLSGPGWGTLTLGCGAILLSIINSGKD